MPKKQNTRVPAAQAETKQAPFFERQAGPLLAAVLLLALGLRVAGLMDLSRSVYVDFLLWDERIYHEIAVRIAGGAYTGTTVYEFAPLFAYLMAGIYWLLSPDIFFIRLLNILFGVLACWIIYGIGVRLGGKKIGLPACLGAALCKPLIFYSIVPLKESLTVLLFALTALFLLDVLKKKPFSAGWLGLALGLLINVRPNAIVLIPLLFAMTLWHSRSGAPLHRLAAIAGLFVLGFGLAVAPFVIRNAVVAGKFALTTSQSGFNLYLGNRLANPDPYYRPVPFASSSPFEQGIQFTIEASRRAGKTLSATEASEFWTKEVLREALAEPRAFAGKLFLKSLALVNRFEACDHYDIDFVSGFVPFLKLPFLSFWFIFPLAMTALAARLFRDSKARALALLLAAYAATLVLFFTNARYRLPMLAVLIPLAAWGAADLAASLRGRRFRDAAFYGTAALAFLIVAFLPVRAADDRSAYYNTHAIILDSRGFENEALLYWRRSSEMNRPFSAFANLALAGKYFQRGRLLEGNGFLARIPDDSFAAAAKYELRGDLSARQEKAAEAIGAYERSLAINSGQRRTLVKLIQMETRIDPARAARREAQLRTVNAFYGERQAMEVPSVTEEKK
jgi:4-amino-4-deoxy-L-arabinose transferase-like glycosyltransferase